MNTRIAIPALALVMAGCSKDIQLPQHEFRVPAPDSWKGAESAPLVPGKDWWAYFGDPQLDALISRALDCNQNLRAAAARVEVASRSGASRVPATGRNSPWARTGSASARTSSACRFRVWLTVSSATPTPTRA